MVKLVQKNLTFPAGQSELMTGYFVLPTYNLYNFYLFNYKNILFDNMCAKKLLAKKFYNTILIFLNVFNKIS